MPVDALAVGMATRNNIGARLDRFIHALNLSVAPRMLWLCEPVSDSVFNAYAIKDMRQRVRIPR